MALGIFTANYKSRKALKSLLNSHLPACTMVLNKLLVSDNLEIFVIKKKTISAMQEIEKEEDIKYKAICILDSRSDTHLDVSYYNFGNRDDENEANTVLVDFLINERKENYIVFSGINERYVDRLCNSFHLTDVFKIENSNGKIFKKIWENPCYLYINQAQSPSHLYKNISINNNNNIYNDKGYQYHFHDLSQDDAVLVNDKWTFKSEKSLQMVQRLIASRPSMGIYITKDPTTTNNNDNDTIFKYELVSWVLSYDYHALGLQHTVEEHRRKGLGRACVQAFLNQIATSSSGNNNNNNKNSSCSNYDNGWRYEGSISCIPRPFCYIVKGNQASSNLYSSLGFTTDKDKLHYWLGFQRQ